jgi:hypothetical protein
MTIKWRGWTPWALVFVAVAWAIPSIAAHYNGAIDDYVRRSALLRSLGIASDPYTVDVKVWPQADTVQVGGTTQYVAAVLLTDGSVWCSDGGYNNEPGDTADRITMQPWTLDAECRAAAALLDTVVIQDTTYRAVRLQWADQSGAERLIVIGPDTTRIPYDSVRYNVRVRSPDLVVFDSIFADTVFVWSGGTFGQQYFASGVACGHLDGTVSCAARGDEIQIVFPYPRIVETTVVPMLLLADTVDIP